MTQNEEVFPIYKKLSVRDAVTKQEIKIHCKIDSFLLNYLDNRHAVRMLEHIRRIPYGEDLPKCTNYDFELDSEVKKDKEEKSYWRVLSKSVNTAEFDKKGKIKWSYKLDHGNPWLLDSDQQSPLSRSATLDDITIEIFAKNESISERLERKVTKAINDACKEVDQDWKNLERLPFV